MANYNTNSGFNDLDGSMVVTNNNVDSYTSNTLGSGTVRNLGGSGLSFNVSFSTTPPRTYHVNANANAGGNGYGGNANNNGPAAGEEPWAATASTAETEEKKAAAPKPGY
jgi:hypothetical protein